MKKGLSNIIATVLLILLAIAAIVIAWFFLSGSLSKSGVEIKLQTELAKTSFSILRFSETGDVYTIVIQRGVGGTTDSDLIYFPILVFEDSLRQIATINLQENEECNNLAELETCISEFDEDDLNGLVLPVVKVSVFAAVADEEGNTANARQPSDVETLQNIPEEEIICFVDNDGDNFGGTTRINPEDGNCGDDSGEADNDDDCNDISAAINPLANEDCNDQIDNNCNGVVNEDCTYCGDGIIQAPNSGGQNETCDGNDLNNQTCVDFGFDEGDLDCNGNCRFDTSLCSYQNQTVFVCNNTLDDDGDTLTDYSADPGCETAQDNDENNCGDDTTNGNEICDGNSESCMINNYLGEQDCNLECSGFENCVPIESCGDGVVYEGVEDCEPPSSAGCTVGGQAGTQTCTQSCIWGECVPIQVPEEFGGGGVGGPDR